MDEVLRNVDAVYMSRIQTERTESYSDVAAISKRFLLTSDKVRTMKEDAIIMHPLPRIDEISTEVDADPRAVYFKQAKYGLFVRMALLKWILGEK